MSARLSRAIVRFAALAPDEVHFSMHRTYEPISAWTNRPGPDDLFYEGRAAVLTYTTSNTTLHAAVFAAAAASGVDFANHTVHRTQVTLLLATRPASCSLNQLDMAFLVDGSGSISDADWEATRRFLLDLVAIQDIGDNRTRIAITTFSGSRNINPNRTQWPNESDCPVGTQWLQPDIYPEALAQVGHHSSACACEGGVVCTPSSNQTHCTNLGARDGGHYIYAYRNSGSVGSCGTEGGTGTFQTGLPRGGVRNDLLFSGGVSLNTVRQTIQNMTHPGGFTWTRAGIEEVRDTVFAPTNGMRDAQHAIPRVLVVITDGQATCQYRPNICFDPTESSRLLRSDGVTILAVGVGNAANRTELEVIAGNQNNVFQVSSFASLPDISSEIEGRSCGACSMHTVEVPSTLTLVPNE